jgi:hypothetical protein
MICYPRGVIAPRLPNLSRMEKVEAQHGTELMYCGVQQAGWYVNKTLELPLTANRARGLIADMLGNWRARQSSA